MATNDSNQPKLGRQLAAQAVHYLRKGVTFADMGTTVMVGTIPAGSLILKPASGAQVTTAFNSATTAVMDIGSSSDGDLYATDLDIKTAVAFLPLDEAVGYVVADETTITAALAETGTGATAGAAEIVIAFIPDNDQ